MKDMYYSSVILGVISFEYPLFQQVCGCPIRRFSTVSIIFLEEVLSGISIFTGKYCLVFGIISSTAIII